MKINLANRATRACPNLLIFWNWTHILTDQQGCVYCLISKIVKKCWTLHPKVMYMQYSTTSQQIPFLLHKFCWGKKVENPGPTPLLLYLGDLRFCIMPVDWSINCWFQKDSRAICSWVCTNTVLTRNYWYKLNLYSFTNRVEWAGRKNCRSLLRVSWAIPRTHCPAF